MVAVSSISILKAYGIQRNMNYDDADTFNDAGHESEQIHEDCHLIQLPYDEPCKRQSGVIRIPVTIAATGHIIPVRSAMEAIDEASNTTDAGINAAAG